MSDESVLRATPWYAHRSGELAQGDDSGGTSPTTQWSWGQAKLSYVDTSFILSAPPHLVTQISLDG